jgi:trehalose synthase-fused probable maltokinase
VSSVTDVARALDGLDLARIERARWFAGKGRGIAALHLADALPIPDLVDAYLLLVDISYMDEGPGERYLMPAYVSPAGHVWEPRTGEGFWEALMAALRSGGELPGVHGLFELRPNALLTQEPAMYGERALGVDQSNTSVILGERVVLKAYRLLATGEHPEVELGRALEHAHYPHVPAFAGSLHHLDGEGRETALAIVQRFVPDSIDPWEGMASQLGRMIASTEPADLEAATDDVAEIGRIAAELHIALARELGTRRATAEDLHRWRSAADRQLDLALATIDGEAGEELKALEPRIRAGLAAFEHVEPPMLSRTHGDLHWGQFLRSPSGVHVVDFEGEPTRSMDDRRRPASPMRDLACLVRSLDHVARMAELRASGLESPGLDVDAWIERAQERCIAAYTEAIEASDTGLEFDPALLRAFELEKETYEFLYAARFLPSWLYAPRLGMRWLFRHG